MTSSNLQHPLPSRTQLVKATLIALVVAGVLLFTTVLPAEYGIDPTGLGRKLGLYGMSADVSPASDSGEVSAFATLSATTSAPAPSRVALVRNEYVVQSASPFRTGEMQVTLLPDKGAEIKARMHKGEQFTFGWSSDGGPVEFDMHGEEVNAAKDVFTSYWQAEAANGSGSFTAPFDGSHGWYWHNHGTESVTVTVSVSGFFSELYRP
jgi:hypothetical protein